MLKYVLIVLISATALLVAAPSAQAQCPIDVSPLVGTYDFTTMATGSKNGRGIGTRGFYRATFKKRGCDLIVGIGKAGYDNVRFKKEEIQYGTFKAEVYPVKGPGETRLAVFVDATLKAETDFDLPIGLTFIGEMGFFRYLGTSWDKYGYWGVLKSVKRPNELAPPDWVTQPKCIGKSLSSGKTAIAGLFACDEIAMTTPDLRRVLYFHPIPAYGAEGVVEFEKIVDSGTVSKDDQTAAFVVFCATLPHEQRQAWSIVVNERGESQAGDVSQNPKYAKACQVREPSWSDDDARWGGTIGGGTKAPASGDRWGGTIGGGTTAASTGSAGNPFAEHSFLPKFVDRFCRGEVGGADLTTLKSLAQSREISPRALIGIFNIYGAFYGYAFKSELWLNDLYYGSGARYLPASCTSKIRAYASARDIPMAFGKTRDQVRQIWTSVK